MPERTDSQDPAIALLHDLHGYEVKRGAELSAERKSEGEVWLRGRLEKALKRLNPGLSSAGVKQAMVALEQGRGLELMEANEACHTMLSRWVTVEEASPSPGQPPLRRSVQFFDFAEASNNDFLVVEELSVRGAAGVCRFDLVVFVNGLPLAVMECKDPADRHAMEKAVGELLNYQSVAGGVPKLFHTVGLCVALSRHEARYGTVTTPAEHYATWKSERPYRRDTLAEKLGREVTVQDVLLSGLCDPTNLLDMVRGFTVFERQGGRVVKKLARYQQWEAVRDAADRCEDESRGALKQRGGVIWHTQGSGKSLTMLWLALRLKRSRLLANPTLLVITDRRGLDRQLTRTFHNCGFENPVSAKSGRHLQELLDGPGGRTVLTTIQKFQDEFLPKDGCLADGGNIIALIDEAHRTEYGVFNARLRSALPGAALIGFTGTPIPKTAASFGSYIHRYTMPQSVEDGATVPILYESRLPELAVWGQRLDPLFDREFPELTDEQRDKVRKQEVTAKKVAEASNRIEMIAFDIAEHYRENFEADGFKAQVAACSQRAAARYFVELDRLLPGRVAVLLSDPKKTETELWELKRKFQDEDEIVRQFVEDDAKTLAIMVVVDKYLTGFDAPIERALYLDKPLQDHGLLQAIARVNRPYSQLDKQWGLVVDYWGVAGFLDQALKGLYEDLPTVESLMSKRDGDEAFTALRGRHSAVKDCFPDGLGREQIEPWILALEKEDARAVFLARYRSFYKALEQLLPDPRALAYLPDLAWLRRVRKETENFYEEADLKIPDCSERVRELISKAVLGQEVVTLLEPVSILSKEFEKEMAKLASDRAKALRMRHALKHTISVKLNEDPALYESLKERLERIIADKKISRIDDVAEFKLLSGIANTMREQEKQQRHVSAEARPFFHALVKAVAVDEENLVKEDGVSEAELSGLAEKLIESLRDVAVIDWRKKAEVQREMRKAIKRQVRMQYAIPQEKVESLTLALMDLARVHLP